MNNKELHSKVHSTMYTLIKEKGIVSPVEVLMAIGVLSKVDYENWRYGRVDYLERVCHINLKKLSDVNYEIRVFARKNNLKPSFSYYKRWNVKKKGGQGHKPVIPLRFSKSGDEKIERAYATHYISPRTVDAAKERKAFNKRKDEMAQAIAPCGLICALCSESKACKGCPSGNCGHAAVCYQRKCCDENQIKGCWKCPDFPACDRDMFSSERDPRLKAFVRCAKEDGPKALAGYVLRNQDDGILYHRDEQSHTGDYDGLGGEDAVLALLRKGKQTQAEPEDVCCL